MSYSARETGQYSGQPIELYRFTRGLTSWLYTSADQTVVYADEHYVPLTMRRGDLPQNEERNSATLELWLDPTADVVAEFIAGATATPTNVLLLRRQRLEAGVDEQAVLFVGQVGVVEFTTGEAHFVCVPMQKALQRKIPRWVYQTQCNHMLYDQFCGVNPAAFTFPGTIAAIVGRTLTVPEAAAKVDGYYNGGYITDGDTFAFIMTHVGDALEMLALSPKIKLGDAITTTAGCDRTQPTCIAKFANLANFMGFPWIPDVNPYGGGIG